MARGKEVLTAAGTLGCAAAVGFVMQSSDIADQRYSKVSAERQAILQAQHTLLDVESITLTSAVYDDAVDLPGSNSRVAKRSPPPLLPRPDLPNAVATPDCAMKAEARAMQAAMVSLSLSASCLPNERISIHHNGMIFTETTSAEGSLDLEIPALARDAVFILAFGNGEGAVAQTRVDDLTDFDRVVLQWKGDTGFQIHAREFGADYGAEGHVWAEAPGEMSAAMTGESGYLVQLGNTDVSDPLMAEVYSFPAAAAAPGGKVDLSVETEISAQNCGMEIEAQALELSGAGQVRSRDLTLAVPDCDTIGGFLVLNNLLQDMKVAQK
ncbi:hypothetical protein ACFSUD_02130 [Sulfitobacter aestuarii]|uniref:Translocase n=1 Tax=Sulfitobacter aestuarii TaxID=2161676 RepID=A0ABW5TXK5_9RHOB